MFSLVRVGKEWAGPVFPHPLKSKGNICIHDRIRLSVFFCRWLTICTTVFPHLITFCMRLMFNLVRMGKEWAGPVFPHPITGLMHILDRVFKTGWVFPTPLTICTTVFPLVITLCIRLMFNLARVGKEWAGPVFPHPLKSKSYIWIHDMVRLAVFFHRQLTTCTTVFPHLITFCLRLMFNLVRVRKEWAGPVFPHPLKSKDYMCTHDRVSLAVFSRRGLTICTTVFPHLITLCIRLMFNLVKVGKEWAGPVFPHPLTSSFMFHAYSGKGNLRLAEFFPTPLTICITVFPYMITLCIRLMFNLVRVGKEWVRPIFPHPLKSKGYTCIHDRVRLSVFSADN